MAPITITHDKRTGRAARLTHLSNGWIVETWYDRYARGHCTQIRDEHGNQRGNDDLLPTGTATYNGHYTTARLAHQNAVDAVCKMVQDGGPTT